VTAVELATTPPAAGEDLARLRALLTPRFLEAVGWDPERVALVMEPGPFFRNHRCPSKDCGRITAGSDGQVCTTCQRQARLRGVSIEEIIRTGSGVTRPLPTPRCGVADCGRARHARLLCVVHEDRRSRTGLDQAAYIATNPEPVDWLGECAVPACLRDTVARKGCASPIGNAWEPPAPPIPIWTLPRGSRASTPRTGTWWCRCAGFRSWCARSCWSGCSTGWASVAVSS
jgi:hypothetical protein